MFWRRLRTLWVGFWDGALGREEARRSELVARGKVAEHKRHLADLRDAMTEMIFQRKKLQDRLDALTTEQRELTADVQAAADADKDEVAVNLLARLESRESELKFTSQQVAALEQDLVAARELDKRLTREVDDAERALGALTSRQQALRVRRRLGAQLDAVAGAALRDVNQLVEPLKDELRRLEADVEAHKAHRDGWEKDWEAMRAKRTTDRHAAVLAEIKARRRGVVLDARPANAINVATAR
jgi:phage shock protein A